MAKRRVQERAGNLVWEFFGTMITPQDSVYVRAAKTRCSTAARKMMNDKSSRRKLEGLLAANFVKGDYFLTLTYDNAHLPDNRESANKQIRSFLRKLKDIRKKRGERTIYIYCTEVGEKDNRLHHHMVVNEMDIAEIKSIWQNGFVQRQFLDGKDYESVAAYMCKQQGTLPNGKQCWTPCRELARPVVTREIVSDSYMIVPPDGAEVLDKVEATNQYGTFVYIKYRITPQPIPMFYRGQNSKRKAQCCV